jgi:Meckel syndrome type 1 protein
MPANTPGTPIDDDDILDLTEVVDEGGASAPGGPPGPDEAIGADFGADLDALLDSLTAENAPASAPPVPAPPAPQKPIAAPIANPTPPDHAVDPDETLPASATSDIDSLLAELGVADTPRPPAPERAPAPAPAPGKTAAIVDDLPEDLAELMHGAPPVGPVSAPIPIPAPSPAASAPVPAPAPAPTGDTSIPQVDDVGAEDTIDLNELDALLDNMLATAPVPGPAAAPAPAPAPAPVVAAAPAPAPAPVSAPGPVPEAAVSMPQPAVPAAPPPSAPPVPPAPDPVLDARLGALEAAFAILQAGTGQSPEVQEDAGEKMEAVEARLGALEAAFAAMRAKEEARIAREAEAAEAAEARLGALETAFAVLKAKEEARIAREAEAAPDTPDTADVTDEIVRTVDDMLVSGSPLMERIVAAVTEALAGRAEDGPGKLFLAELEKMTAAAAARIIREEIGALAELSE